MVCARQPLNFVIHNNICCHVYTFLLAVFVVVPDFIKSQRSPTCRRRNLCNKAQVCVSFLVSQLVCCKFLKCCLLFPETYFRESNLFTFRAARGTARVNFFPGYPPSAQDKQKAIRDLWKRFSDLKEMK